MSPPRPALIILPVYLLPASKSSRLSPSWAPLSHLLPTSRSATRSFLADLGDLGFILKGSVVERRVRCSTPGCRCHSDPEQLHGPYLQWSTAVGGKTVTRRLTPLQARRYRSWIDNRKHLEQILGQMHDLAAQADAILAANEADQR